MKLAKPLAITVSALVLLQGCAQTPMGPRAQVLPGPNKPYEVFQQESAYCKQMASSEVNGQAQNANERALGAALIGAALGTGVGAVAGGGKGAGVGAAVGGVAGTAVGAGSSASAQHGIQQQYDNAYVQCMLAKGNQLPAAPVVSHPTTVIYTAPPAPQPTVIYTAPPAPPPTVIYTPPPASPPVYYTAPTNAVPAPPPPGQ